LHNRTFSAGRHLKHSARAFLQHDAIAHICITPAPPALVSLLPFPLPWPTYYALPIAAPRRNRRVDPVCYIRGRGAAGAPLCPQHGHSRCVTVRRGARGHSHVLCCNVPCYGGDTRAAWQHTGFAQHSLNECPPTRPRPTRFSAAAAHAFATLGGMRNAGQHVRLWFHRPPPQKNRAVLRSVDPACAPRAGATHVQKIHTSWWMGMGGLL